MEQDKGILVLDLSEEAFYISKCLGCSIEAAKTFVELEDVYYDSIGLNVYELDVTHEELRSEVVVDDCDVIKFICMKTDTISEELCARMLETEYEYFKQVGLVEER